jgi:hypothetical protein
VTIWPRFFRDSVITLSSASQILFALRGSPSTHRPERRGCWGTVIVRSQPHSSCLNMIRFEHSIRYRCRSISGTVPSCRLIPRSVHGESSRSSGTAAFRRDHYLAGLGIARDRRSYLGIGVHREDGGFDSAEGYAGGLRETHARDHNLRSYRPAWRGEFQSLRNDAEHLRCDQIAARLKHGDLAGGCAWRCSCDHVSIAVCQISKTFPLDLYRSSQADSY